MGGAKGNQGIDGWREKESIMCMHAYSYNVQCTCIYVYVHVCEYAYTIHVFVASNTKAHLHVHVHVQPVHVYMYTDLQERGSCTGTCRPAKTDRIIYPCNHTLCYILPSSVAHITDITSPGLNLLAVLFIERHSPHSVTCYMTCL